MTKEELERQKWNDIFLEDCAVYDNKIAEEYTTLQEQIAKLKERNAELKGMYAHSAREAETYKQFFEKEKTENAELKEVHESDKRSLRLIAKKGADLEKKISVLLSCKNCPNNKGGYICQKEYEDKCLAQKIQYIKELEEENKKWKDEWQEQVQKENNENYARTLQTIQLNKAKELIKNIIRVTWNEGWNYSLDVKVKAEDFLKESE